MYLKRSWSKRILTKTLNVVELKKKGDIKRRRKMFNTVTPEQAGISSAKVLKFIKTLDKYHFNTHSIIMARGNDIFAECYYEPFHKDFKHRMYSVSKSFVSVAIGMCEQEGLLSLDDKLVDHLPEYVNEELKTDNLLELTIRDMLVMQTSSAYDYPWFNINPADRTSVYFNENTHPKMPGSYFCYDSSGSYILGVVVEKLTGKPFLKYLQEKFFDDIGFSKDAYCLKAPGGHSWGDSGVICTSRDLLTFARFVMNGGTWDGKRYMNEQYLLEATKKQVCNDPTGVSLSKGPMYGYGYQIWIPDRGGFSFYGMGDQFAICDRETDFIFIINSDNQGNSDNTIPILFHTVYDTLVDNLGQPLPEDKEAYNELCEYMSTRKLYAHTENIDNPFVNEINGKTYKFDPNPLNLEYVRLEFDGKKGKMYYKNKQGDKCLDFGLGYNEFSLFPEEGYSDEVGTVSVPGHKYKCAASADWCEDRKLRMRVQIIDKYFGNLNIQFSFKDKRMAVVMNKTAEAFLNEYTGYAVGVKAE